MAADFVRRFGPATADRSSRGIRDQPRNPPKYTEKRIRINFPFPCPSVLLTFKIFEACADFLTPDGLGSCRKCRNFGAHRSLVQSCGCGLAALGSLSKAMNPGCRIPGPGVKEHSRMDRAFPPDARRDARQGGLDEIRQGPGGRGIQPL